MNAIVRQDGRRWFVEHAYPKHDAPTLVTLRWEVTGISRPANYGPAPELVDGLAVEHVRDTNAFQAYEHGNYLVLETAKDGTNSETPIPAPKTRQGIETRYYSGRWEKYLKSQGWVAA